MYKRRALVISRHKRPQPSFFGTDDVHEQSSLIINLCLLRHLERQLPFRWGYSS